MTLNVGKSIHITKERNRLKFIVDNLYPSGLKVLYKNEELSGTINWEARLGWGEKYYLVYAEGKQMFLAHTKKVKENLHHVIISTENKSGEFSKYEESIHYYLGIFNEKTGEKIIPKDFGLEDDFKSYLNYNKKIEDAPLNVINNLNLLSIF